MSQHQRHAIFVFLVVLLVFPAVVSASGTWSLQGYIAARGVQAESQPSWLEGGLGRLPVGAELPDDDDLEALGQVHLVAAWSNLAETLGVHLHVAARAEPSEHRGGDVGLIEGFLHGAINLRKADMLRYKLGLFILPTSRENVEVAWASPYTLNFSVLNAWIGEEVRLTGGLLEHTFAVGSIDEVRLGASLFGGNDTAGTLLAWRGWVPGDRLAHSGEVLPLAPLIGLERGEFRLQRDDGTRPIGSDLDGRAGWAAYARWQRPRKASVQLTHYDNNADRRLHDRPLYQYAWRTYFNQLSVEFRPHRDVTLLGEAMVGKTGMGDRTSVAFVDVDFETAYVLASWNPGRFRVSTRWETFETEDRDGTRRYDVNTGEGEAWTAAFFWDAHRDLRLGFEYMHLDAERPVASSINLDPDTGGEMITLELRYFLDF